MEVENDGPSSKDATNGAPGLTTRSKKLLVTKGIATNGAIGRYERGFLENHVPLQTGGGLHERPG